MQAVEKYELGDLVRSKSEKLDAIGMKGLSVVMGNGKWRKMECAAETDSYCVWKEPC
ncbi:conserved hypothetical protein [Ricinus communis]|uniref:Uncharacterized protein n=1 Tax=Ricinus communis TaxID=3988 RepID=B9SIF8_RICCO|nr:conserved hypothetical protein [Ricinus communis]